MYIFFFSYRFFLRPNTERFSFCRLKAPLPFLLYISLIRRHSCEIHTHYLAVVTATPSPATAITHCSFPTNSSGYNFVEQVACILRTWRSHERQQGNRLNICREMQGTHLQFLSRFSLMLSKTIATRRFVMQNILASNWQGYLNTIKADAKGR